MEEKAVNTKIQKMIEEMCPGGVEWKRLGDIAEVGTGSSNGKDAQEDGEYPFFIRSKTVKRKNDYEYDEEAIIIPGEGGIGDIYHYVNGKYALHQRVYRIHFTTEGVDTKFVYYYFSSAFKDFIDHKAVNGTVKSIRKPMIEDFSIPIPPLAVQREVVRVLDTMTELTAKLNAELTARRKQYEYYRNEMLRIEGVEGVEYRRLGDIFKKLRGTPITARKMKEIAKDDGDIRIFAGGKTVIDAFEPDIPNPNITRVPAVLVQSRGIIDFIYYDKPFTFKNEMWAYTADNAITVKYLYYCLKNDLEHFRDEASKMGSMPQISTRITEDFIILIPPLSVQQDIVQKLDAFSSYCTDLTSGLPAEIEAREKQYAYYRDTLLQFRCK